MRDLVAALPPCWGEIVSDFMKTPQGGVLESFLQAEAARGETIYPARENFFRALHETKLDDVRVVILGQDPYHGPSQAHGLSFSVPDGVKLPPSLRNIYKEIAASGAGDIPQSGNLTRWARQGVLLLNDTLSVRAAQAASHRGQGWEELTLRLVRAVNEDQDNVVFLLWGSHAQKKAVLIDPDRHHVLESPHPSPLSAHRGFLGCDHFRKANEYLTAKGRAAIAW